MKNKVPITFPGTVQLQEKPLIVHGKCSKVVINPEYRKEVDEDFYYFVTRVLPAMNPSVSNYKRDKNKKLISDIFSVADEAFGLIMLHNEYDVWKGNYFKTSKTNSNKKKFLDAKSGRRDGWTEEGKNLFYELCEEVKKLRDQPETGLEIETQIKNRLLGITDGEDNDEVATQNSMVNMQPTAITKPFRSPFLQHKMMERNKAKKEKEIQFETI